MYLMYASHLNPIGVRKGSREGMFFFHVVLFLGMFTNLSNVLLLSSPVTRQENQGMSLCCLYRESLL